MDIDLFYNLFLTLNHSLSIFACLWVCFNYFKLSNKAMGIKMITILGISDIFLHISLIFTRWLPTTGSTMATARTVEWIMVRFSAFWATSIAYFVYRSFSSIQIVYIDRYFYLTLSSSMLLSILIDLM